MKEGPLVSVIIPVYNAEKALPVCLSSIERQTYRSLEILFVNDASTDASERLICDFQSRLEDTGITVKIICQDANQGVASARNKALDIAEGKYVYSIDSDDYLDAEGIEEMVKAAERENADLVGIDWYLTYAQNERHVRQAQATSGRDVFANLTSGVSRWNLWLWLIKREIIEKNAFRFIPGVNMGEDLLMMLRISLNAGKTVMINKPMYHYVQTNSTALTKEWSDKYVWQVEKNVLAAEDYIMSLPNAHLYVEDLMRLKLNIKLPLLISSHREDYERWLNWFPEANKYIASNKKIPFRTKFIQLAAVKRQFWILKAYHKIVTKFIYGVLYR